MSEYDSLSKDGKGLDEKDECYFTIRINNGSVFRRIRYNVGIFECFLLDEGLSNAFVGVLLAIGALTAVLFQPLVGALIDRNPRVSTRGVLLAISVIIVAFGLAIILIPGKSTAVTSGLYGMDIFMLMLAQPFLNALGMDAINYGYPINFGVGRSLGSFGYAAGSYAFGIISVKFGPKSVSIAFSIAFFILCLLAFLYPVKKDDTVKQMSSVKSGKKENPFLFLGRYKRFAVILSGLILIYFSHSLINTFALQIVVPKGGTSGDMGTASAIAAVCELITTLLFSFYMSKIKLYILLKISGIFFTLKIFFSFLITSVPSFFFIQGFLMFGWGIMSIGIVYYVNNLVGKNDKAQGQAYAGMAYTIASVLGNFLGGTIIDKFGVNAMLLSGTASAMLGTIILWISINEYKVKEDK